MILQQTFFEHLFFDTWLVPIVVILLLVLVAIVEYLEQKDLDK